MSIICGSDLSAASAGALEVAVALAKQRGDTEVLLVHVVDPELGVESAREHALEQMQVHLEQHAAAYQAGPVTVRTQLVVGPGAETLVGLVETEHSDLVVIAARSKSTTVGRLGTTTAQIIARSMVPVIVVRDPAPWLAFTRGERPLRLMIGIDDSAVCDLGIQWTHLLRQAGQVDVVLGAIYYPDDASANYGLERRTMVDRDPEIEQLMTRDLIRRFGDVQNVVARPRLGLGRIGDHMVELAREENVDAILVGTGQKTGLGRLGSVSSVIVNDASQSVVCVPPQAQIKTQFVPVMKTVVVATDLSPFANRAVAYAFAIAEPDADVHIVHVIKDDTSDHGELSHQLSALAPPNTKQRLTPHVIHGDDAADTIARCAARLGGDVICIASHGRSGLSRALVGSVADRLLRATRLPVLVLRPA
ncbi:MAG TPA: universal stress protein [Kofleriaceae bacterium]|nr:universal stress protein [Kofleriaceae bacterium]